MNVITYHNFAVVSEASSQTGFYYPRYHTGTTVSFFKGIAK